MTTAILSSAYFAPVQWFQKINTYQRCLIEHCDTYIKQTYRNRCIIATEAGRQSLTVPIEHGARSMRDIRISDHGNWRHLQWNALVSAYGESPFFEFYADDIHPFFERRWDFLFDFNMEITMKMCELLDIKPNIELTTDYVKDYISTPEDMVHDFREAINSKHPDKDSDFNPKPYYQVYARKNGFQPNLSILDLLFNEGNEAIYYLS